MTHHCYSRCPASMYDIRQQQYHILLLCATKQTRGNKIITHHLSSRLHETPLSQMNIGAQSKINVLLPPAYVVRREGNVLTRVCPSIHPSICLSTVGGGVPISHNALQHFPECHGAAGGGTLPGPAGGGTLAGGTLAGGVPWPGGTLAGGYPGREYPGWGGTLAAGGYPGWGGVTQLGQHREYLLHSGRYASCVHAGGLSCFINATK